MSFIWTQLKWLHFFAWQFYAPRLTYVIYPWLSTSYLQRVVFCMPWSFAKQCSALMIPLFDNIWIHIHFDSFKDWQVLHTYICTINLYLFGRIQEIAPPCMFKLHWYAVESYCAIGYCTLLGPSLRGRNWFVEEKLFEEPVNYGYYCWREYIVCKNGMCIAV